MMKTFFCGLAHILVAIPILSFGEMAKMPVATDTVSNADTLQLHRGFQIRGYTTRDHVDHRYDGYARLMGEELWKLTPRAYGGTSLQLARDDVIEFTVEDPDEHGDDVPSVAVGNPLHSDGPDRWYGGSMLVLDAAAWLLVGVGIDSGAQSTKARVTRGTAATLYALGGPSVHFVHGHYTKGLASVGLRAAGLYLGLEVGKQYGNMYSIGVGSIILVLASQVIDDLALARAPLRESNDAHVQSFPGLSVNGTRLSIVAHF